MILDNSAKYTLWKNTASLTSDAGEKMDIHIKKTETRSLSFSLYKNQLKIDQRP
jgi:hypothetical protein